MNVIFWYLSESMFVYLTSLRNSLNSKYNYFVDFAKVSTTKDYVTTFRRNCFRLMAVLFIAKLATISTESISDAKLSLSNNSLHKKYDVSNRNE